MNIYLLAQDFIEMVLNFGTISLRLSMKRKIFVRDPPPCRQMCRSTNDTMVNLALAYRLERSWRRWKSPFDRKKFRAQCNFVRSLISKAKSNFLTNLVTESSSNPRTLWKTLNSILHRNLSNPIHPLTHPTHNHLPIHSSNFLVTSDAFVSNFLHPILLILFFFQLSLLQIYLISIRPLSQKFVISFSLLKTNNVNLTQFLPSF